MNKTERKTAKRAINTPCGLCGTTKKPRWKTDCCGNWICGDESEYVMFSYSRDICSRNHRRYTLCGYHHMEEHAGDWKTCRMCRESFQHELEMYVWYGMNEYNFEKLKNPPVFEPTYCFKCKNRIVLPEEGYTTLCDVYCCENCEITDEERAVIIRKYETSEK